MVEENKLCTVIYDSECSLCVRFKKALELIDSKKNVSFLSVYDQKVYIDFPELTQQDCLREVHLIDNDGNIHVGSAAIEFLVKILPGVSKFSWLLDSESGKSATNAFYKKINEMRMMKKRNCYTCGSSKKRS